MRAMPTSGRKRLAALAAGAALGMVAVPANAANVLQNPGAEADASDSAVSGWQTFDGTPGFLAKVYGVGGFPGTDVSAANGGGNNFFWPGNNGSSLTSQTYTLTPAEAAQADAGNLQMTVAADIGGFSTQRDHAEVTVGFQGPTFSGGTDPGPMLKAVFPEDRDSKTTLIRRQERAIVPAGTRAIQVLLSGTRLSGNSSDGYLDNIFLELTPVGGAPVGADPDTTDTRPAPPPPITRGIPNPTVRRDGSALVVAPGATNLRGCRRGDRKRIFVRVQSSTRGEVFVSVFSGVASVRLFGSRWVTFGRAGSRRVAISVPCPARTADVRTVGLKSALATVERGDRRGISTPQAKARGAAAVITSRARAVRQLRRRNRVDARVRAQRAGRVVVTLTGRANGLRFRGRFTIRFSGEGVRKVSIPVRLTGRARTGTASITIASIRFTPRRPAN